MIAVTGRRAGHNHISGDRRPEIIPEMQLYQRGARLLAQPPNGLH